MRWKRLVPRVALILAGGMLSGCDPNPDGPSAPSAPSPTEGRPAVRPPQDSSSPLRQVGPPVGAVAPRSDRRPKG